MNNRIFDDVQMRDTQGLVFSGYGNMPFCSYYLLKIDDTGKVRPWLKKLATERITPGEPDKTARSNNSGSLNLAISYAGFEKLTGKNDSFEQAFQEGMNSPRRSTVLGDQGNNHPGSWLWGNSDKPVDIVLMLYSIDKNTHTQRQKEEEMAFEEGGLSLVTERLDTTKSLGSGRIPTEHFGFADGVSDPLVAGFSKSDKNLAAANVQSPQTIATGEFLLGYPNGYDGKITAIPNMGTLAEEFGVNGTYLVFRQLQQDVKGFWSFIHDEAEAEARAEGLDEDYLSTHPEWLEARADYIAAKFVGRWKNGAVVSPGERFAPETVSNDFDFRDDLDGKGCPFGSHIRRSNPRGQGLGVEEVLEESIKTSLKVANRHRIMRRGRSYGNFLDKPLEDEDKGERGLFFICLNANIERQFEFIQHTWINNLKFNGLYDEDDPLIGSYGSGDPDFTRSFTLQDEPLRRRICHFQEYVTLRGGGYYFLPGIRALRMLGE